MKKYIDRKILESLIAKYGAKGINNAINRLNENNENPKSGIFIEYHDHLNYDAFRILVLDNGVNILKNDPLEIKCEGRYSGKQYIEKLEPKYGKDYIEVDYVHSYSNELCLTKVVKELHAKYSNLPIYCFTEGFYVFKGEYKNVQKLFNDIFSKYLRDISFEFIPGTMGEFLKSDMNESLKTDAINETENEFEYQSTLCSDWFGSRNNCKLVDNKSTIDKWMGKKINDILKTGEVIDDGFSKTAVGPRPDRYEVYVVPKDGRYIKYESFIIKYSEGNDNGNYYYIPNYVYDILEREFNRSSKTNIVNEAVYEYDYNRLSDCPLTYNTQLDFKKYFIKRSAQEGYKFNKNIFYFDNIYCVDTKTSRDIPGVKANKTLNFDEAYNRLLKYFLNNLQEQVNESNNQSMYDAFGEVIYPSDYVIVVAHNDKYPEGKMLKGTFVKLAANSRLVGVIEIEEYDQKMYKFPKYIKEPQTCIAKYK